MKVKTLIKQLEKYDPEIYVYFAEDYEENKRIDSTQQVTSAYESWVEILP